MFYLQTFNKKTGKEFNQKYKDIKFIKITDDPYLDEGLNIIQNISLPDKYIGISFYKPEDFLSGIKKTDKYYFDVSIPDDSDVYEEYNGYDEYEETEIYNFRATKIILLNKREIWKDKILVELILKSCLFEPIPQEYLTYEKCKIYSGTCCFELKLIPEKFRTLDICKKYIENRGIWNIDLTHIPEIHKKECEEYVHDISTFVNIPKDCLFNKINTLCGNDLILNIRLIQYKKIIELGEERLFK